MATREQLVKATADRILRGISTAETKKYNEYFNYREMQLPCKNTRIIKIREMIPKDDKIPPYYAYEFIDHSGKNDHMELNDLAGKVLDIGYENNDISGCMPFELTAMGFIPEDGTGLASVSNMLTPDNYKLVTTGDITLGPERNSGHEGQPYFGPIVQDVLMREDIVVMDVVVAHRQVVIGTHTVTNYCGD